LRALTCGQVRTCRIKREISHDPMVDAWGSGCRVHLPSRQQCIQLKTWLAFTERLNRRHLEPLPRQVIVKDR